MKRWNADTKISAVAVFISFCALTLALYEGSESRRHNRLSVKPVLTIDFSYKDEGAGFFMVNNGVGPAIIHSFEVFVDKKPQRTWEMAAETLGVGGPSFYRVPSHSSAWSPDDKEPRVFWINKSAAADLLKKENARVQINVCYCSIYDECWVRTRLADLPKEVSCGKSKGQLVDKTNL